MASLKKNIALSYINTITGVIFPLITFPYATRVLMSQGIGTIDFLNSIVNYIVLFTSLGIPFYAVREIAICRDDIYVRNKKTIEITILNLLLCIIGYFVVFILGLFVPQIKQHADIFYILSLSIIFTAIGVQWFYQAIEDFEYITIRGIVIRVLCASGLFIFVKTKEDLIPYAFVLVGSTVGNNLLNFIHLRKFIHITRQLVSHLHIMRHLKPSLKIFVMFAFVSIYVYLNSIILGFLDSEQAVGYYSAGVRIPHIVNTVVTSIGAVMLPRCSNLIETGKMAEFKKLITKSYHFIFGISLPLTIGLIMLAKPITLILCGTHFEASVAVVRITAATILCVSLSDVIGMQILFPMNKENIVIASTCAAAISSVIFNFALIPFISAKGAAVATLAAEFSIIFVETHWGKRYIPFKFFSKTTLNYIAASILMSASIVPILAIHNLWIQLIAGFAVGATVYMGFLYYNKDELVMMCLEFINKKKQ